MRGWLLDTNVISELRRPRPDQRVRAFIEAQPGPTLFTSSITFAEIRYGIELLPDAARRADVQAWLDRTLRPFFADRVLAVTEDAIVRWKTMVASGRKRRHTFSQPDLFIAAMAALEDMVVVTRDTAEFTAAGVPAFDPWASALHFSGKCISIVAPATLGALVKHMTRQLSR